LRSPICPGGAARPIAARLRRRRDLRRYMMIVIIEDSCCLSRGWDDLVGVAVLMRSWVLWEDARLYSCSKLRLQTREEDIRQKGYRPDTPSVLTQQILDGFDVVEVAVLSYRKTINDPN
jgi:hypothetical protein